MPADVAQLELLASELKAAGSRIRKEEKSVVADMTEQVAQAARGNAAVLSGEMRDSVTPTVRGLRGRIDALSRHSVFNEFGTSKMDPQPFMMPALEANQGQFLSESEDAAQRALEG